MGSNAAEAHPVAHAAHAGSRRSSTRRNFIVIDPRLTRTAAHATEYVRMRPGTDIPVLYGMMWHILKNGWEDKEFIKQRVYGFEDLAQGNGEVDAGGGRARHRRSGRAARARRQDVRDARSRRR